MDDQPGKKLASKLVIRVLHLVDEDSFPCLVDLLIETHQRLVSYVRTVELQAVSERKDLDGNCCYGLELLNRQVSIKCVLLIPLLVECGYKDACIFLIDGRFICFNEPGCQLLD